MLDDHLAGVLRGDLPDHRGGEQGGGEAAARQEDVQVPGPLDPQLPDPLGEGPALGQLGGDLPGGPLEGLGEVERGGEGEVAEGPAGGDLHDGEVVGPGPFPDPVGEQAGEGALPETQHGRVSLP